MKTCALCHGLVPAADLNRFSGLDVCSSCSLLELSGLVPSVGMTITFVRPTASGNNLQHRVEVVVHDAPPVLEQLSWQFRRERLLQRVRNRLLGELQIGDPLFDQVVSIEEASQEDVELLLGNEGLQSAILSLVSHMEGTRDVVRLHEATLHWSCTRNTPYTEEAWRQVLLECLAIGIHLRRLCS